MNKYILYIGLNDRYTRQQEIETATAENIIFDIIGDNTIQHAIGYYTNNQQQTTKEVTLIVTKLDFTGDLNINKAIKELCLALNQESIALETNQTDSKLIYANKSMQ